MNDTDNENDDFDDFDISLWLKAMALCRDDAGGKRGVKGIIKCPKCGGKLHYSVATYNGHLWGSCEKEGCISWMQ